MRMILLSLVVLASTVSHATDPVKRKTIPFAFHGDWALEGRNCGLGPSDSGNMRITARKVTQFEMVGKVTGVKVFDPGTVWVESRITHNNTAYNAVDTFNNIEIMTLSSDKQQLTTGEHSDISVYKRCNYD
jgi:hypothetical protein